MSNVPEINIDSTGSAVIQGKASEQSLRESKENEGNVEYRQIITQRIVKDQEKVDRFFREKADQLKSIASYQKQ